ncbi:MAG: TIGR02452 family protein [Candidatus Helarchaeota archaeon]
MIYSPEVPVIRDDKDEILDRPHFTSIITAPAVNVGIIRRHEPWNIPEIKETMQARIERALSPAIIHDYHVLVLGACGCGVFKNDPADIASYFANYLLEDEGFSRFFTKIVFAILDNSNSQKIVKLFDKTFSSNNGYF